MKVDLSSEPWLPLLLEAEDSIILDPCHVVNNGRAKCNDYKRSYTFVSLQLTEWSISFDLHAEMVSPCGPDVLTLLYQRPAKRTLFRPRNEGSCYDLIAIIGLNKQVQIFDFEVKGSRHLHEQRKALLVRLANGFRNDLAKYAHYFGNSGKISEDLL